MVLQKRLDYGFIGYQVPAMPRGRRSSMGRCSRKRKVEEIDMGAFELLATVAGKLLEEIETSPDFSNASSEKVQSVFGKDKVKEEQKDEEKSLNVEPCDQGSSHESGVHSHNQKKGNSEELEAKPHLLVSSDTNIEVPSVGEHLTSDLFPECQDVKLVSRDDDEKSSGCTRSNVTPVKASRLPTYVEDQKIIKMASKYWQVAPKLEGELSNSDEDIKPISRSKKISYKRQRSLRDSFKRRKVEKSSVSTSDEGDCSEGIFSTPKKGISESSIGSGSSVHAGSGVSTSSAVGLESSSQSRGSHVKLSIKSFKVPELFIDISETATVGSLKRTVMEAVAAILGEGLHVGILYEGEKIEDDSKTLLQTGICDDDKLGCLGFALEPNQANSPASLCLKDPSFCPNDVPQPLARYIPSPALDVEFSAGPDDPPLINLANGVESDQDSVPSPSDMSSIGKVASESRALVAVPAASTEALAAAMNRKSRRAELAQRRIRRPFSVSEVEALVHAVEKLGTGRWRDVKLRAFDNAKHRTYVDLKDKWKTLVHTARISPQQRRGEPVPQELLDRVLSTHGYWSQHQAKQQVKQLTETCLLLNT